MRHIDILNRSTLLRAAVTLVMAGALALPAAAQQAPANDIVVDHAWARSAARGGVGGAFLTLENRGDQADRLVSAASPVARTVELHNSVREGDVMRMRPVQTVEVPAHGAVQFRPGGLHIMMVGLNRALNQGEQVPLTLTFERAGSVTVNLAVQAAGATGMSAMPGMQGHGDMAGQPASQR
jgi:periplasmic copper chaperone A